MNNNTPKGQPDGAKPAQALPTQEVKDTKAGKTDGGEKLQLPSIAKAKVIMDEVAKITLDKELVNFLKGLPSMIMQNGLGQTVAFLQTNGGKEKKVKDILQKVILPASSQESENQNLMLAIVNAEPGTYLQWQKDAIEYAGWIKKFALAFHFESGSGGKTKKESCYAEK